MKIKLTAPKGYKYRDTRTDRDHSEVITEDRNKGFYVLVPETEVIIKL